MGCLCRGMGGGKGISWSLGQMELSMMQVELILTCGLLMQAQLQEPE